MCHIDFWATIYISPGASQRLQAALSGSTPASEYDREDVVTYIWNEARYPTVADSAISANVQALVGRRSRHLLELQRHREHSQHDEHYGAPDPRGPVASERHQYPADGAGPRAIYNTIVIVLVLVQEFFYLGIFNAITAQLKIWNRADPKAIVIFRFLNSFIYSFLSALCTAGAIWAFRAGWDVDGAQFVLTWMVFWLLGHLSFFVLDIFTVWLPPPMVPMALIAWIIMNIASIVLPFELCPGFFKIGYVFPAHAAYNIMIDIWSGGCNPQLPYALPTMFAWELVSVVLSGSACTAARTTRSWPSRRKRP